MKKILFCFILLFSFNLSVKAEKLEVTLNKCVDGDTAWFNLNNEKIKARFLAIDTPESTTTVEAYGKEASEFTCNKLKNAKKIEIEYDPNSDKLDKYERHLVWVFVDDALLQDEIVKNGLAEVKYIYGNYMYTDTLENSLSIAKENKLGMWEDTESTDYTIVIIIACVIIVICLFSAKMRKKVLNKTKSTIKRNINKKIKNILK
jgi:micrococcal nuclease